MNRSTKKEDYCPPDCVIFYFTVEQNTMSGFDPKDWEDDDDEIG